MPGGRQDANLRILSARRADRRRSAIRREPRSTPRSPAFARPVQLRARMPHEPALRHDAADDQRGHDEHQRPRLRPRDVRIVLAIPRSSRLFVERVRRTFELLAELSVLGLERVHACECRVVIVAKRIAAHRRSTHRAAQMFLGLERHLQRQRGAVRGERERRGHRATGHLALVLRRGRVAAGDRRCRA
jgi:hypothetical protein